MGDWGLGIGDWDYQAVYYSKFTVYHLPLESGIGDWGLGVIWRFIIQNPPVTIYH
ncbi:MAG: hypothetical protein AAF490_19705 [Chloroflexota bacterium]